MKLRIYYKGEWKYPKYIRTLKKGPRKGFFVLGLAPNGTKLVLSPSSVYCGECGRKYE